MHLQGSCSGFEWARRQSNRPLDQATGPTNRPNAFSWRNKHAPRRHRSTRTKKYHHVCAACAPQTSDGERAALVPRNTVVGSGTRPRNTVVGSGSFSHPTASAAAPRHSNREIRWAPSGSFSLTPPPKCLNQKCAHAPTLLAFPIHLAPLFILSQL